MFKGKSHYAIIPRPLTKRFFERLEETHDFDEYQRFITNEAQKQQNLLESLTRQLAEIDSQQEAILTEIVDIRKQIKEKGASEQEKQQLEAEAQPIIDRLRSRFTILEKPKKELTEKVSKLGKNDNLATLRKYADFQTEVKKLVPVWNKKPISVRCEFVNLFVKQVVLTFAAPPS